MALQSTYKQFLAAPNAGLLASNASLHYITTLTSFNGPVEIIKHLNSQNHELKKKEEKVLGAVEGTDALAVEVHTTIEFVNGGGAYLPGLDDNFLADRVVNLPIIHIVTFDPEGKILQIRLSWDQGSLLRLIDIIGRTGRNWPIRDGKDQIKLITSSVKLAVGGPTPGEENDIARSRPNSNHVTRDPHATLSLFAPREKHEAVSLPAVVETRRSAAPPQRDFHDLFAGNGSDRSLASPDKVSEKSAASKAGAGKNYAPSRIFDQDDAGTIPNNTVSTKVNAKKYQHFDFADGPDDGEDSRPALPQGKSKHSSQWDFVDFVTPAKVVPSKLVRTNDIRHWGNSDDEVIDSPIKFKKVVKPRKDTETHFEFNDDGTPDAEKRQAGRPRGTQSNNGMGLYRDKIFGDEEITPVQKKHDIVNADARRKIFDSQFSMTDEAEAHKLTPQQVSETRAKAIKMMDANWSSYDRSPNANQKENIPTSPSAARPANKIPLTETTNQTSQHKDFKPAGDGMGSKKGTASQEHRQVGIATGGDGMGGRKGVGRSWGFGDESDGEGGAQKVADKFMTGKTQGKRQPAGGDFWDF